jgi:hypothetical protein
MNYEMIVSIDVPNFGKRAFANSEWPAQKPETDLRMQRFQPIRQAHTGRSATGFSENGRILSRVGH